MDRFVGVGVVAFCAAPCARLYKGLQVVDLVSHVPVSHPRKSEVESEVRAILGAHQREHPVTVTLGEERAAEGASIAVKVVTSKAVRTCVIEPHHDRTWIRSVIGALLGG